VNKEEFKALPSGTRVRFTNSIESTCGVVSRDSGGVRIQWDDGTFALVNMGNGVDWQKWLSCVSIDGVEMVDGLVVSTDTHCYHLIPQIAMQRLCERISLGEQTNGKDAWNAMSENQGVLESRKALARRFGHLINHSYRLLGKLQAGEEWTEDDEREASAVMWGGMFAICAIAAQRKKQ
jgi:hypothetical protein